MYKHITTYCLQDIMLLADTQKLFQAVGTLAKSADEVLSYINNGDAVCICRISNLYYLQLIHDALVALNKWVTECITGFVDCLRCQLL